MGSDCCTSILVPYQYGFGLFHQYIGPPYQYRFGLLHQYIGPLPLKGQNVRQYIGRLPVLGTGTYWYNQYFKYWSGVWIDGQCGGPLGGCSIPYFVNDLMYHLTSLRILRTVSFPLQQ